MANVFTGDFGIFENCQPSLNATNWYKVKQLNGTSSVKTAAICRNGPKETWIAWFCYLLKGDRVSRSLDWDLVQLFPIVLVALLVLELPVLSLANFFTAFLSNEMAWNAMKWNWWESSGLFEPKMSVKPKSGDEVSLKSHHVRYNEITTSFPP